MLLIGTTSFSSHGRALRLPKQRGGRATICGTIEWSWINFKVRHIATSGNWRTLVEARCRERRSVAVGGWSSAKAHDSDGSSVNAFLASLAGTVSWLQSPRRLRMAALAGITGHLN